MKKKASNSRTVPSNQTEQCVINEDVIEGAHIHEARLSRVRDYQAKSLAKEDDLEANLGSINSGLMRVALWLDEAIEQALESGPRSIERLKRMLPAIDTHLRVARQVDRFAQIEIRAAESRKPRVSPDTGGVVAMPTTPALPSNQSEET